MIEPDMHEHLGAFRRLDDRIELPRPPGPRFLDQRVLSSRHGRERHLREHVVRGCDDDHVDVRPIDQRAPLGQHLHLAGHGACQGLRALPDEVGAGN